MTSRASTEPLVSTLPTRGTRKTDLGCVRAVVAYGPVPDAIGRLRVLGASPVVVGREADGIALPDGTASRAHAVFESTPEGLVVRDLASRNGLFVNGRRTAVTRIAHGDVVRVGDHVLVIQELASADVLRQLDPPPRAEGLLGDGVVMRALLARVAEVATGTAPVLVLGESGAGKELVAAHVHRGSNRSGAFVPVNCAAIPEQLAESELFGHQKGAFTGAQAASDGLFGAAHQGTIFLDEIGETSLATQARLLRVLEGGEVRRVGDTQTRRVDVRVVAATNVDLEAAVASGRFRGDLLARLRAHVVVVPPLRMRREDLLGLAVATIEAGDRRAEGVAPAAAIAETLTPDAAEALLVHGWPWNVRELVQTARALHAARRPIALEALPPVLQRALHPRESDAGSGAPAVPGILEVRPDAVPDASELRTVLAHFGGNVSRVAAFFGKERKQIYRWAERLEIDLEASRDE